MPFLIDGALYPDRDVPLQIDTLGDRVDFLARLCSAWDFGRLPDRETVEEIRRPTWREAVDATRLLTSPAYHLLRFWHGLPRERDLGRRVSEIRDDPNLEHI